MVSDLFHAGHVAPLREACRHGDRPIVGVLSDAGAAAPSLSMGIAPSCMTAPPRPNIAYDKDTKGAGGRSHPHLFRPGQHGLWDWGGADFREHDQGAVRRIFLLRTPVNTQEEAAWVNRAFRHPPYTLTQPAR